MEPGQFNGIMHFLIMLYGKQSQVHIYFFSEPVCLEGFYSNYYYSLSPSSI